MKLFKLLLLTLFINVQAAEDSFEKNLKILTACANGDIETVKNSANHEHLNTADAILGAIFNASYYGHPDIVKFLVKKFENYHFDISSINASLLENSSSGLCLLGDLDAIKYFFEHINLLNKTKYMFRFLENLFLNYDYCDEQRMNPCKLYKGPELRAMPKRLDVIKYLLSQADDLNIGRKSILISMRSKLKMKCEQLIEFTPIPMYLFEDMPTEDLMEILDEIHKINPNLHIRAAYLGNKIKDNKILGSCVRNNIEGYYDRALIAILFIALQQSINKVTDKEISGAINKVNALNADNLKTMQQLCLEGLKVLIKDDIIKGNFDRLSILNSAFKEFLGLKMFFTDSQMAEILIELINTQAITEEHLKIIKLIHDCGFNFENMVDSNGRNILSYSLEIQKTTLSEFLIKLCPNLLDTVIEHSLVNTPLQLIKIARNHE